MIDRYCIGCHDGKAREDGKTVADLTTRPKEARSFTIMLGRNRKCNFTPSYWTLRSYVRSTNEADNHLLLPYEFSADSSKLIQMLRKGHHNVELPPEAWDRLITWIDLSAPAYGTWTENVGDGEGRQVPHRPQRPVEALRQYRRRPGGDLRSLNRPDRTDHAAT